MNQITKLQILTESLPLRCEVCHQTDCFDPDQNWCSRCKGLTAKIENPQKEFFIKITAGTTAEILVGLVKLGLITGGIGCLALTFFWASAASVDAVLVLAVLALATGLVGSLIFGVIFVLGIITLNGIEQIKWRLSGRKHPLRQF